ncbi:hypothetical protein JD844_033755 [Phrynosoma platyrhinos]|uniref:Uncharacterized protein n=1 Tax=Phrynosoma platyrhinos TaxID=52577 RepID=A0ABQ7T6H1_PHRPL|nr:hypothetical protein JD844_033755 [Phrynosoma platyrhinos]
MIAVITDRHHSFTNDEYAMGSVMKERFGGLVFPSHEQEKPRLSFHRLTNKTILRKPDEKKDQEKEGKFSPEEMQWPEVAFVLSILRWAHAETYTSMLSIHQTREMERELLQNLHTYLEEETKRLSDLRR